MVDYREFNDPARARSARQGGSAGPIIGVIAILLALAAIYFFATSGSELPTAAPDVEPTAPIPAPEPATPAIPAVPAPQ